MQNSKDKTGYLFATKYKRHAPGTVAHSMFENLTGGTSVPPALLTEGVRYLSEQPQASIIFKNEVTQSTRGVFNYQTLSASTQQRRHSDSPIRPGYSMSSDSALACTKLNSVLSVSLLCGGADVGQHSFSLLTYM